MVVSNGDTTININMHDFATWYECRSPCVLWRVSMATTVYICRRGLLRPVWCHCSAVAAVTASVYLQRVSIPPPGAPSLKSSLDSLQKTYHLFSHCSAHYPVCVGLLSKYLCSSVCPRSHLHLD